MRENSATGMGTPAASGPQIPGATLGIRRRSLADVSRGPGAPACAAAGARRGRGTARARPAPRDRGEMARIDAYGSPRGRGPLRPGARDAGPDPPRSYRAPNAGNGSGPRESSDGDLEV